MRAIRPWQGLLGLVFLLAGVGGLTVQLLAATGPSPKSSPNDAPKLISPPECSVLLSRNLDVIYRGGDAPLEVDSRPVPWEETYLAPIHVGRVQLTPGMHRLRIGDRQVQMCVALNEMEHDGPADWPLLWIHTMSADKGRCAECHATEPRDHRLMVGEPMVPDSCMTCHDDKDVKEIHCDLVQPLKSCQTCHLMHGSPNRSLLKAPATEIRKEYGLSK